LKVEEIFVALFAANSFFGTRIAMKRAAERKFIINDSLQNNFPGAQQTRNPKHKNARKTSRKNYL